MRYIKGNIDVNQRLAYANLNLTSLNFVRKIIKPVKYL